MRAFINSEEVDPRCISGPGLDYGRIPANKLSITVMVIVDYEEFIELFSQWYDPFVENERDTVDDDEDFEGIPEYFELQKTGYLPLHECINKEPVFLANFIRETRVVHLLDALFPRQVNAKSKGKVYCFVNLVDLNFENGVVTLKGFVVEVV